MERTKKAVTMEAAVRDNQTKETMIIKSEYSSKKAFREDLNRNGYTVIGRIMIDGKVTDDYFYSLGVR